VILGLEGARQQHAATHARWKQHGGPPRANDETAADSGQRDV
jgi:hypothetical protein